jgi:glycosyltransferase involved in cell wall biosynthesis
MPLRETTVDRPLRICFIAYRGNMLCGGQGVYLWFLARELSRLGHEVEVLVGPPYPDPMPFAYSLMELPNEQFWGGWFARDRHAMLPDAPLRIFEPLNFYELAASWFGFLPEPFAFSLRALRQLKQRLRLGIRYDIVHDVQCLGWGDLVLRAMGLPLVTTIHHPLTVDRRFSFIRDESFRDALGSMTFYPAGMQAAVARRVDRLFTSSQESAKTIARDFGVRPERICMVANGVDTVLFSPDPSIERDPNELLCVGRASDPNKGLVTLIDALPHLPEKTILTLVDDDVPDNVARKRAHAIGVANRVRIVGRVPTRELVGLYRRCALVVVPSRYEGFGLPAAEAMACGAPVVACASGALPEVVTTGGGGRLVPRDDPKALAAAVRELLAEPGLRAELGVIGRKGIDAAYAWPRVARRTAEVYAEVVAERRGRPANTTTSASAGNTPAKRSKAVSAA